MAKKCIILPNGNEVCSKPNLFMSGYLGKGPFQAGFSAEAQAVFDLMNTDPPADLKNAMAIFIDSQVLSGNWVLLDVFQFYAMDTAANAVLNWIANVSNAILVNGPTHDPFDRIILDGITQYINTVFIPSGGTNFTQNDCLIGVWIVDLTLVSNMYVFGANDAGFDLEARWNSTNNRTQYHVNDNTISSWNNNPPAAGELLSVGRENSAATKKVYKDIASNSAAIASVNLPTVAITVGANSGVSNLEMSPACFYAGAGNGNFDLTDFQSNLSTLITTVAALG